MRRDLLAWGIIWRMAAWGFGGGASVGLLYGLLVIAVAGSTYLGGLGGLVGLLIGGISGFGAGLLDGFALAGITHLVLPMHISPTRYRAAICSVSAFLTCAMSLLMLTDLTSYIRWNKDLVGWIIYAFVPTLIAIVVAVIAGAKIAAWVENTTVVETKAE